MRTTDLQMAIAFMLTAHLALAGAAPSIGVAVNNSDFRVDASRVQGSATLFEGNVVETGKGPARLYLNNGARVRLAARSKAAVFADRLQLQAGAVGFSGAPLRMEALSLRVENDSPRGSAGVSLVPGGAVRVSALDGSLAVRNGRGVLVARLAAGTSLEMFPAPDTPNLTRVSGIVKKAGGRYILQDQVSGVSFELRGEDLDSAVDKKVEITGTVIPGESPAAAQILQVSSIRILAGAAAPAVAAGAAGSGGGVSAGTIAVIAGVTVAVAATTAGIALSGDDEAPALSPSTR
jgi:hypothetical protein